MPCNIGDTDRLLRIFAGLILILWVLIASGPVWAWIGVAPLLTGIIKFCPAYTLLGINTNKTE